MVLEKASKYHDLGKLRINPMVLSKTTPLNDFERKEIMSHAKHSGRILLEVGENKRVIEIAMLHHENYDGTGYPFRLKKAEIPLEARIIRVADVFDALRSERAYKKGFSVEKCKEIMIKEEKQYDPEILKALMSIL
jgi:HD-GYP domain-containing protein (c-di-GMP phosphodiesterase class II)